MTKHIQSVFNFLGAKLTTAAIDAKLSMTTSEHKHVGICRWCGNYIAYKNHEFVNLCAVYFQVGPKELKTCASGSYLNAKALHLPLLPLHQGLIDRQSPFPAPTLQLPGELKITTRKVKMNIPNRFSPPMIRIYRGCAIPAHPNLWEHNSDDISDVLFSFMQTSRQKISRSVEFLILFCKIKLLRAFSTNSNSMFLYVIFLPQDHLTSNHAQPTSCTSGSAASVTDFCADTLTSSGS